MFDSFDEEMVNAKTGSWYNDNPQRARSNNSAVIIRNETSKEVFESIFEKNRQFGEPGFVFFDDPDFTTNPCVEIGMWPFLKTENGNVSGWQGCNLTEINGGACDTEEQFYEIAEAAAILGTLQAGYTDFKFVSEATKEIFRREALLGVSVTGWMNNPKILLDEGIQRKAAQLVVKTNVRVADLIGINHAARTTCVKPSGNASVLLMTASGIHGEHAPRYIRNVQLNKESEVAQVLKKTNPNMITESVWSANNTDYVASFPFISKEGSIYKDQLFGTKLLKIVKSVQENWVEAGTNLEKCVDKRLRHNVSNTIQVDDWDKTKDFIWENRNVFAGISLLGLSGDKDYEQAPVTEVLTSKQILKIYGDAALFASGMVVDSQKAFGSLWKATSTAQGFGEDISEETAETMLKRDWVRRYTKFAQNYFNGDLKKTEYCLKDVALLHQWNLIQRSLEDVDFKSSLTEEKIVDIDTMGSAACVGTKDGEGCLV